MSIKKSLSLLLVVAAPSVFAQVTTGRSEFKLADLQFVGSGRAGAQGSEIRPVWAPFVTGKWNTGHSTAFGFGLVYKQFGTSGSGGQVVKNNGAGDIAIIVAGTNNTPVGGPGTQTDLFIAGLQIDDDDANLVRSAHLTYVESAGQAHLFIPSFTLSKANILSGKGMALNLDLTESYNYFIPTAGSGPSAFSSDVALSTKVGPFGIEGDYTVPSPGSTYDYYFQATASLIKNTGLKVKYDRAHNVSATFSFRF